MLFHLEHIPSDFRPLLDRDFLLLNEESFFYFLEEELIRAQRESFYVSILLFRLTATDGAERDNFTARLKRLAALLRKKARRTDYLGYLGDQTFSAILLDCTRASAPRAAERLISECGPAILGTRLNINLRLSHSLS